MGGRNGLGSALIALNYSREGRKGRSERPALFLCARALKAFSRMVPRTVEAAGVRVGFRTLVPLALCAAAMAAAIAHLAIDVLGDYALPKDSFDYLRHGSRELVSGVALLVAAVLAAHGLRICCEVAAKNRTRLLRPVFRLREMFATSLVAVAGSAAIVPAMEYLDGRHDANPVLRLADAFGGSIPLGLGTTLTCAAIVAFFVCSVARWLISHRDSIATIIETFLRWFNASPHSSGYERVAPRHTLHRRRAIYALRLAKRGPPETRFA